MAQQSPDVAFLRVSTGDIPDSERTSFWREAFARKMCGLEFEPLSEGPLDVEATMLALPGLSIGRCRSPMSARWSRTSELVKDGDDTFALIMPLAGAVMRRNVARTYRPNLAKPSAFSTPNPAAFNFDNLTTWP